MEGHFSHSNCSLCTPPPHTSFLIPICITLKERGIQIAYYFSLELPITCILMYFLTQVLQESLEALGMKYHKKGTMVTIEGPRFSTQAESHMFRSWNADLINMTTVPEVLTLLIACLISLLPASLGKYLQGFPGGWIVWASSP